MPPTAPALTGAGMCSRSLRRTNSAHSRGLAVRKVSTRVLSAGRFSFDSFGSAAWLGCGLCRGRRAFYVAVRAGQECIERGILLVIGFFRAPGKTVLPKSQKAVKVAEDDARRWDLSYRSGVELHRHEGFVDGVLEFQRLVMASFVASLGAREVGSAS
jgi:hypothetical protein